MRDYKRIFGISLIINILIIGILLLINPYTIPLNNVYYFAVFIVIWITMSEYRFEQMIAIRRKNIVDLIDNEITNNLFVILIIIFTYLISIILMMLLNYFVIGSKDFVINIIYNLEILSYIIFILMVFNNVILMLRKYYYKYIFAAIIIFLSIIFGYSNIVSDDTNIFLNIFYPIFNKVDYLSLLILFIRNIALFIVTRIILIAHIKDKNSKYKYILINILKYILPILLMYLYALMILKGRINDPTILLGLVNLSFVNFNEWGFGRINIVFISGFIFIFLILLNNVLKNIKDDMSFYQFLAIRNSKWVFKFEENVLKSIVSEFAIILSIEMIFAILLTRFDISIFLNILGYFIKISLLLIFLLNVTLILNFKINIDSQYIVVVILVIGLCLDLLFNTNVVTYSNNIVIDISYSVIYLLMLVLSYRHMNYISNKRGDIL